MIYKSKYIGFISINKNKYFVMGTNRTTQCCKQAKSVHFLNQERPECEPITTFSILDMPAS